MWEMYEAIEVDGGKGVSQKARMPLYAQSGMVLDVLGHITDALDSMRMLKNKSVFRSVAIPVAMAIATIELCFMNPEMFLRNIQLRKVAAVRVDISYFLLLLHSLADNVDALLACIS
jgi:farnesyl-diphosphate farnesyltransferase